VDLSKAKAIFFDESREQCDALERALLDRDAYPANEETFNLLFRTAHTIKGSAGVFGLDALVRFAHVMENVLERLRSGQIALTEDLVSVLLACNDHLRLMLDIGESDESQGLQDQPQGAPLLVQLHTFQRDGDAQDGAAPTPPHAAPAASPGVDGAKTASPCWHFSLRFHADIFRMGFDPLSFVTYLNRLGRVQHVQTIWRAWPDLGALDPTECFFGLELALESDSEATRIRETFEFVQDDSYIGIVPPHAPLQDHRAVLETLKDRFDEPADTQIARWLAHGALTQDEAQALCADLEPVAEAPSSPTPASDVAAAETANPAVTAALVFEKAQQPGDTQEAGLKTDQRKTSRSESQYVRVEAAKLDRLINRVGELVIAASGTTLMAQALKDPELLESVAGINALVESIRDDALTLRMVPVGDIFSRFPRLVRETANLLGKEIRLDVKGAETEIDKSMVEKLSDPLMHIVRNALDHGMETPEQREKAGKSPVGTVTLDAYHDTGAVVVEIRDDGSGINRDKVLAKARERGLVPEGRQLSDQEIFQLIFLPGFSTADAVSDLSGRGVGMDVVKRSIESLRGVVEIDSKPGLGTVFRLRLPLTLAIIDGFRVEVDDATLVMPLDMMYECVDMPAGAMQQHARQINVRGEWLPFVSLREMFGLAPAEGHEFVVIVHSGNNRAGIVVDKLLGEVQAVIKPMGEIFKSLRGFSGSTILGNGRPALVLDIPQLIQHAWRCERRQAHMALPVSVSPSATSL
jgi:two-component system chemotaxis sensor kinase CheA